MYEGDIVKLATNSQLIIKSLKNEYRCDSAKWFYPQNLLVLYYQLF